MITCKKTYFDIPFAHRQHLHDGHCSFVHGHNWDITIEFACNTPDENGFVVDFGKLKFIKTWIDEKLDHACLFAHSDPLKETLKNAAPQAWHIYELDSCSCEGLASHLLEIFNDLVKTHTNSRVWVRSVTVSEDKKNEATAHA